MNLWYDFLKHFRFRFAKARIRVLEKQVEDGKQLRQQLLDQVHDIQKQLKNERDENKKLKKRLVQCMNIVVVVM